MKTKLLTIMTTMAVLIAVAQNNYFTLTPEGFVNTEMPEQVYMVIDFKGKSQEQLYKAFLTQITTTYVSAKDVVSKVEKETISIHAFSDRAIAVKRGNNPTTDFDLSYNISFQFKDNRVRVNAPQVISMTRGANNLIIAGETGFLSDKIAIYKKGMLKIPSAKQSLEDYFNSLISEIVAAVKSNKNNDW